MMMSMMVMMMKQIFVYCINETLTLIYISTNPSAVINPYRI